MKVCYIGPYKYNNFFGIVSRNIIDQLASCNIELVTKHIFINNPYDNTTMVDYPKYENNISSDDNYDIILQHAPVEMLQIDKSIGKAHIAMPIFDYAIHNSWSAILQQFDKVITDDIAHLENIREANISADLIEYSIEKTRSQKHIMNLGYHNHRKKFYFVGNYLSNQNIINKIIVSFILAYRGSQDFSLILFLNDEDIERAEKTLSQSISELFTKLNYNQNISPIKYIIQPIGIEQLHMIHNSCDIFLDLYDTYETGLNRSLACVYSNHIIDVTNTETISVPSVDLMDYSITKYKKSILSDALIKSFLNTKNKNIKYMLSEIPKSVKQILCI